MKIRETSAEEDAELALRLQKTDSHSETNVANLIVFDEPVIVNTNPKQVNHIQHFLISFIFCHSLFSLILVSFLHGAAEGGGRG